MLIVVTIVHIKLRLSIRSRVTIKTLISSKIFKLFHNNILVVMIVGLLVNLTNDLSESNEEFSSTDDDSFSLNNIGYVEASPPDSELFSSEVLFDAKCESDSSDDQSSSDEDILKKIVSKPFSEEEIIPMESL
nr:hypothetical protein [Tanacetum cinerariifolium]